MREHVLDRDDLRTIERVAKLIRARNVIEKDLSRIIGRPAEKGHIGEYLAQEILGVVLEQSATRAGIDGRFANGPLKGKNVDVKTYAKREGTLAINEKYLPDYYLIFAGPKTAPVASKGTTRPFVITEVFLFDAKRLVQGIRARGTKVDQFATSVRQSEWDAARIYPDAAAGALLSLSSEQRRKLAMFAVPYDDASI